ncbi:MAG: CDP-alcohol phosphatidyltransferase family protein [Methanophagales archaeon]|jgi:phosphatidylglycerophosphate synthase|nr:CDP-diacylglycerol--glycerol-3-phosphate 3-phosphatidyltransferase/archaetidylinositol phosphate synthase [Methanophagales archaeon]MCK4734926.1 CDP-alcohol phosphatidyltransferase family protein [Methanophagales archaeon]
MVVDSLLRSFVNSWKLLKRIARYFAAIGLSPDSITILSLLSAILAGVFFFFSGTGHVQNSTFNLLLLLAGIFVCLSSILDALDGIMARELGNASKRGDFLDHVIDRYADMLIVCGIIFGGYVSCKIGVIAVIGILFSSYMGTQAQAVGLKRIYGGLLGRADRLLIIIVATFLTMVYPYPLPASGMLSYTFLGWAMVIFALLCNVTALQRFYYAWKLVNHI